MDVDFATPDTNVGFYLQDHQTTTRQYRSGRAESFCGQIVVHTAENTPDYVAFDGGAEAVANFIRTREDAGSYHSLADSDSIMRLVSPDNTAFGDRTGSNPFACHVSFATRHDVWHLAPEQWRKNAIYNAAWECTNWSFLYRSKYGMNIPPRLLTREESERRRSGFISHSRRDPARRKDPGDLFPWTFFLSIYSHLLIVRSEVPYPTLEVPAMGVPILVSCNGEREVWLWDGFTRRHIQSAAEIDTLLISRLGRADEGNKVFQFTGKQAATVMRCPQVP